MNQTKSSKNLQVVGFKVGKEFFGVDIASVQEIVRVPEITQIPETPVFVEGVINLRGRIVPVIDLRKRLRIGSAERSRSNRVLITEQDKRTVGLIVDSASEVLRLSSESIEPPPEMITGVGVEYITGVGRLDEQIIILLDLNRILDVSETARLGDVVPQEVAVSGGSGGAAASAQEGIRKQGRYSE